MVQRQGRYAAVDFHSQIVEIQARKEGVQRFLQCNKDAHGYGSQSARRTKLGSVEMDSTKSHEHREEGGKHCQNARLGTSQHVYASLTRSRGLQGSVM